MKLLVLERVLFALANLFLVIAGFCAFLKFEVYIVLIFGYSCMATLLCLGLSMLFSIRER